MTHEPTADGDAIRCTCNWAIDGVGLDIAVKLWAEHWAESYAFPRFNEALHALADREVEVLYGVEWTPGYTEYMGSEKEVQEVLADADDEKAKPVKAIHIKEYI